MPYDPWMLIGWLLCVVLVILIMLVPISAFVLLRARRRAILDFEARRRSMDNTHATLRDPAFRERLRATARRTAGQ